MESNDLGEKELSIGEFNGGGGKEDWATLENGTYEASYNGLRVFMDATKWGEKKAARLYFTITRGKYKDKKASYKGYFLQDPETNAWVVGSRSKLAEAIRAVTGGAKTLDKSFNGRRVYLVAKVKKTKAGHDFSFIESIIPFPTDEEQAVSPQAAPKVAVATTQGVAPKVAPKSSNNLLDDLTQLSDFNE